MSDFGVVIMFLMGVVAGWMIEQRAEWAYQQADAMLAARENT